ncbi:MAG: hypothetical protein KIS79_00720 [Burkholderiales bacterium]|nr:hypothetical protein [Burkholderiales bacterium]
MTARHGLLLALALALAACASRRPEPPPEVQACMPPSRFIGGNEAQRLARLTERAQTFAACMQAKGYVLDEAALDDALRRFEQVKNADPRGGDPRGAMKLRKQELSMDPTLWHKAGDVPPVQPSS